MRKQSERVQSRITTKCSRKIYRLKKLIQVSPRINGKIMCSSRFSVQVAETLTLHAL